MNTLTRHRGPDDEGYVLMSGPDLAPRPMAGPETPVGSQRATLPYAASVPLDAAVGHIASVALAHRRLSIVDLSGSGHQPMCDASGRHWVVYNGEIYNHVELRSELQALGHEFVSQSDTEVILHGYREWGDRCLARFNGMFAFVLVDRAARRVLIARDRFGVKPLYIWRNHQGLIAVASEIKQFSVLPGWRPRLNGPRAYDFLNWGLFDHTSETLFASVRQLRGGEMISCSLDELYQGARVQRWYELMPAASEPTLGEAATRVRSLLEDSVRLRLRADVPVGSCLSGGLDSSSIVCVANRLLRQASAEQLQKTFSARSRDSRVDEGMHIAAVVRSTGVANYQVSPQLAQLFDLLPRMVWHQDEPFGSTSIFAQWHVFELAAQHGVRVMLDGQGADEQLAGYHGFYAARFGGLLRGLRLSRLALEMAQVHRVHGISHKQLLAYTLSPLLPEALRHLLRKAMGRPGLGSPAWLDLDRLGAAPADPFLMAGAKATSVEKLSRAQLLATSLPMLLHWEDRDSMAHSVEARVPFLDYRLVELVLGLPDTFKLKGATTKVVLREAMRGVLPEPIRTRTDKIGFATAEEQWVRVESPDRFRSALREALQASCGILTVKALEVLEEVIAGKRPFSFLPWRMICFGAWMKRFEVETAA